jgi:hypothetical protein
MRWAVNMVLYLLQLGSHFTAELAYRQARVSNQHRVDVLCEGDSN